MWLCLSLFLIYHSKETVEKVNLSLGGTPLLCTQVIYIFQMKKKIFAVDTARCLLLSLHPSALQGSRSWLPKGQPWHFFEASHCWSQLCSLVQQPDSRELALCSQARGKRTFCTGPLSFSSRMTFWSPTVSAGSKSSVLWLPFLSCLALPIPPPFSLPPKYTTCTQVLDQGLLQMTPNSGTLWGIKRNFVLGLTVPYLWYN